MDSLAHHGILQYFDEVYGTKNKAGSKTDYILEILKRIKIPKKYALMVGDKYEWDYKPARDAGIDAYLIKNSYDVNGVRRKINNFNELTRIL